MDQIRVGLSEPYKSLIPTTFEGGELVGTGLLYFSRDQEKYEEMKLNWDDPKAVADALISGSGSVSVVPNDAAISVTDISEIHAGEKIVSEDQLEDLNEHLSELGQLGTGENRVEAMVGVGFNTEIVEDKEYLDVLNAMHVAQISAFTATKAASVSNSISLPVRVLEEGDTDYSTAPELSATFTPDTAVTVGEFNEWQGLAIDYYYPMIDAELSEGYDIQAGYTVSIPLENYQGETLSGTLTIPLPQGYDGATARIKGGASASSYTATTVSFPVTMDVSGGVAEKFELVIEYKEAQESNAPVITSGANSTWQKGGTDGLSFTSNAAFADFIKVQVDGKDLDASNYTVKEGSTIVTLNAAYLNTLSVGKHTLAIVSDTGTASTDFTIKAAASDDTQSPQTGNSSNMMLWITLLFVSGTGLFGATAYNRKKKYNQ